MTTIKAMLDGYAAATEKVWAHDRSSTEGASGIFTCRRKRWFAQNDAPHDPDYVDRYGAKRRGDLIEAHWVVPALRRGMPEGCRLIWAGEDQRTLVDGYISATPDGLIVNDNPFPVTVEGIELAPGGALSVEIKSIDPRVDLREAKSEHIGQVHVQMGLIRQCTPYRPDWAIVVYVDASFLDDVNVFPVKFDPAVYAAARARATSIMLADSADALPPEGKIGGGKQCQYCPYKSRCAGVSAGIVPRDVVPIGENLRAAFRNLVERRRIAKENVETAETDLASLEQSIRDLLRENGTRKVEGDGWSITWFPVKGRKSLDRAAVEAAGIDLSPFEREGDPAERLTIKAA